ncbi:MAG: hypothetical protein K5663_03605 [Clostridiales bacterium]|nr:hypothetical protein [Clostridiales bacterium]
MSCYLMGIDAGTTSFKGALFDEKRRLIASHRLDYTLLTPAPDQVEYPAEEYWKRFAEVSRALLEKANAAPEEIEALAISSQAETLIVLDENDRPMGNAIVWLDNRAVKEADELKAVFGCRAVYERSGQADMVATWPASKILWLRRNRPELFKKAGKYMLLEDWLIFRLTGRFAGEPNLWASSAILDIHTAEWWPEMLSETGVTREQLPELLPCGTRVGTVRAEAAEQTGLARSTVVVAGALDQTCNTIGAGVTLPGSVCETTGSCLAVSATLPYFVPWHENRPVTCQNHAVPGRYTVLLWSQSAGMVLKWFAKEFYPEFSTDLDAAFARMNLDAASVPAGCDGLTMLPHLNGASNPEFDPRAKGVFCGVTLRHSRAHFTRAIMEAVAFMLRRNTDQLCSLGTRFDTLYSMGGGARSPQWMSIKASVTGCRMIPLIASESGCLGAALLAGVGVGRFPDIDTAAHGLAVQGDAIMPDPSLKPCYDEAYGRYLALYEALKPYFAL